MDTPFLVDVSPVYDLLLGMALVAQESLGQGRWDAWARETAAALEPSQTQRLARWFSGESPPGTACVAVVPTIAGEHTIAAFLAALEALAAARLPAADGEQRRTGSHATAGGQRPAGARRPAPTPRASMLTAISG